MRGLNAFVKQARQTNEVNAFRFWPDRLNTVTTLSPSPATALWGLPSASYGKNEKRFGGDLQSMMEGERQRGHKEIR
jgi:hypothetical protein